MKTNVTQESSASFKAIDPANQNLPPKNVPKALEPRSAVESTQNSDSTPKSLYHPPPPTAVVVGLSSKKKSKSKREIKKSPPMIPANNGASQVEPRHSQRDQRTPTQKSEKLVSPITCEEGPEKPKDEIGSNIFLASGGVIAEQLGNLHRDEAKRPPFIRRLRTYKYMIYIDTVLTGATIFLFTMAWFANFHVNPSLEMKLTPELQAIVSDFVNPDNFESCNHSSWVHRDKVPRIIDDSRCFTKLSYGLTFFEIFQSQTNDPKNGCDINRVEIHPCYSFEKENDPLNIIWEPEDIDPLEFDCRGSIEYFWQALYRKPRRFPLINETSLKKFVNRTVLSTAFFYQCPRCFFTEIANDGTNQTYKITQISSAEPIKLHECPEVFHFPRGLNVSALVREGPGAFSRKALEFRIYDT